MSDKKALKDYGVMPNMKGKDESVVDFLEKMTWFHAMTLALQKHSEFMRPELADNYPDMEYAYPHPQGLQWDQPLDTITSESFGSFFCPYCSISAMRFRKFGSDDYCDGQICFPYSSVICMTPEDTELHHATRQERESAYGTNVDSYISLITFGNAYSAATWSWKIIAATGNTEVPKLIRVTPASRKLSTSFMCIEPEGGEWPIGRFTVEVTMVDMYGNVCTAKETLECEWDCCEDEEYVPVTFDTTKTSTVVAKGSTITLFIKNGCPPYSWAIIQDGFRWTLTPAAGDAETATLYHDQSCSSSVRSRCLVRVTDACGNSDDLGFKHADGQWTNMSPTHSIWAHSSTARGCFRTSLVGPSWSTSKFVYGMYAWHFSSPGLSSTTYHCVEAQGGSWEYPPDPRAEPDVSADEKYRGCFSDGGIACAETGGGTDCLMLSNGYACDDEHDPDYCAACRRDWLTLDCPVWDVCPTPNALSCLAHRHIWDC